MRTANTKSQATLDFMVSYGFVFLVLSITLYVIVHLTFMNQVAAPSYCTPSPSFSCTAYALNRSGVFTIVLSQATGGTINIQAAACSSAVNSVGDAPAFGNVKIISNTIAPQFYPVNSGLQSPLSIYSSSLAVMSVYCYSASGVAKASPGSLFTGYFWINYTYSNLPITTNTVQRVVQFSTKYS